jgi:regulator of protease activity HflC (stomatin/prohibitin superfamily)
MVKEQEKKQLEIPNGVIIGGIIVVLLLGFLIFNPFYIVGAGERAVVLDFGKPETQASTPGLHFRVPIYQSIVKMTVQTQKYEAELSAASKDLQTVSTKIAINYRVNDASVVELYRTIGVDYSVKVIQPLEQEANKAITAEFTAEELITKREEVKNRMKSLLTERLAPRGIIVEELSIVNFDFSESFNAAIENKVTMQQNALAAQNKLEQIKFEADQRIAQANGEAEAIKIQASSIEAQGGAAYIQLQAIKQWDGKLPTVNVAGGSGGLPFLMTLPSTLG